MSVVHCGGVLDPVQDDEGHAANHDQETADQEAGRLESQASS